MSRYSVNSISLTQMTLGRSMPWLRCDPMNSAQDPSTTWKIPTGDDATRAPLYRELVVLNHRNEVVLTFDLFSKPIDGTLHATDRALVQEALRAAAALPDTDGDHLPDEWETDHFGDLQTVNADSPTPSGLTALLAYGTGQSPRFPDPTRAPSLTRQGPTTTLTYTRRLARRPQLIWTLEHSPSLTTWEEWIDPGSPITAIQYDGTATERVTHTLPAQNPAFSAWRPRVTVGADPAN